MREYNLTKPHSPRQKLPMPKPKHWSHQDDLVQLKGKRIEAYAGDTMFDGRLLDADQFTLKLQLSRTKAIIVVFKSTLTYFCEHSAA